MSKQLRSRSIEPSAPPSFPQIGRRFGGAVLSAVFAISACGGGDADPGSGSAEPPAAGSGGEGTAPPPTVVLAERWISASDMPEDTVDLDSPQVWVGPGGEAWVIVTAKEADQLHVLDGNTGAEVRRVGSEGEGAGQLDRPNGIAIWGDYALVVERDNARVQLFSLPGFEPVGTFGEGELAYPYGIATVAEGDGLRLWITDDYEVDPAAPDYSRRVHEYRIRVGASGIESQHVRAFGAGEGDALLEVVETIWVDAPNDVLLVADETAKSHKIFTLDGVFTGRTVAGDLIQGDPEGSALYRCGDGGYWILTDQRPETSLFLILDRTTFEHLGTFRGEVTANTDGIGITQAAVLGGPGGGVYALQDDQAISAFAWTDVADALGLQVCPG